MGSICWSIFRYINLLLLMVALSGCLLSQGRWNPDWQYGARQAPATSRAEPSEIRSATARELENEGDVLLESGNLPMALVKYHKALERDPGDVELRYKTGRLFLVGGASDTALKTFQAVLGREGEHARSFQGIGHAHFQMGRFDQAETAFTRALVLDDTLWQSNVFLGIIYNYRDEPLRAIREYQAAIQLKPESGMLYNNIGVAYAMAGRYEEAIEAYRQATTKSYAGSRVYNNLGVALGKLGEYELALDAFTKAVGEARAYNNLGSMYMEEGKYQQAIRCFKKAIALKPDFYEMANDNLNIAKRAWVMQTSGGSLQVDE
jgi:tetratricopeptide (TPR) repeat protein